MEKPNSTATCPGLNLLKPTLEKARGCRIGVPWSAETQRQEQRSTVRQAEEMVWYWFNFCVRYCKRGYEDNLNRKRSVVRLVDAATQVCGSSFMMP